MSLPLNVEPSPQMSTPSSCIARTSMVPVTARPRGVAVKYARPPARVGQEPHGAGDPAAVLRGRAGHAGDVRLVVLADVGGVGARDRALGAHPCHRDRGVQPAREGDADALAGRKGGEDLAQRDSFCSDYWEVWE